MAKALIANIRSDPVAVPNRTHGGASAQPHVVRFRALFASVVASLSVLELP